MQVEAQRLAGHMAWTVRQVAEAEQAGNFALRSHLVGVFAAEHGRFAANVARRAAVEAENVARVQPVCVCGRGRVETVNGCAACTTKAAQQFEGAGR